MRIKRHFLVAAFLISASCAFGDDPPMPFTGKVVSIADGDTLTLLIGTTQHKIRLEGIDCPESKQAFGTKAKQALGDKVFGKEVRVEWAKRDRYQRILGHIYLGECWINQELVAEGWAWHYKQFSSDKKLADAEIGARNAKKGLWADLDPIAPWEFRKKAKVKE